MVRKINNFTRISRQPAQSEVKPKKNSGPTAAILKETGAPMEADAFERSECSGRGSLKNALSSHRVEKKSFQDRKRGFLRRLLGIHPRAQPNPRPVNNERPPSRPILAPVSNGNNPILKSVTNGPAPKPISDPVSNSGASSPKPVNDLTGAQILTGWKQGSTGNCVTIAAIKAAQTRFGPVLADTHNPERGIFKTAERTEQGGLKIEMRDGFKCEISAKELEIARTRSKFRLYKSNDKSLLQNANEVYAAAAKRAQVQGNDGYGPNKLSFERACTTLNNGETTASVREQLGRVGLEDFTARVSRGSMKNYEAGLTYTPGHAYFVTNGKRDYYGKSGSLGRGSKYGWVLKSTKND